MLFPLYWFVVAGLVSFLLACSLPAARGFPKLKPTVPNAYAWPVGALRYWKDGLLFAANLNFLLWLPAAVPCAPACHHWRRSTVPTTLILVLRAPFVLLPLRFFCLPLRAYTPGQDSRRCCRAFASPGENPAWLLERVYWQTADFGGLQNALRYVTT